MNIRENKKKGQISDHKTGLRINLRQKDKKIGRCSSALKCLIQERKIETVNNVCVFYNKKITLIERFGSEI